MPAYSNFPRFADSNQRSGAIKKPPYSPTGFTGSDSFTFAPMVNQQALSSSKSNVDLLKSGRKVSPSPNNLPIPVASYPRTNSLPVPSMSRTVYRARSSPNLRADGKRPSTQIHPPLPPNFDFYDRKAPSPIPGSLLGDRFSNASSMTTNTTTTISTYSDRSSTSSNTVYPVSAKPPLSRTVVSLEVEPVVKDSPNAKSITYTHSYSDSLNSQYNSAIDIINDYTDDINPSPTASSKSTENNTNMHAAKIPNDDPLGKFPSSKPVFKLHIPPPIHQKDPTRDRYGFNKKSAHITEAQYDRWWSEYQPYMQRRDKKWAKLLRESGISVKSGTAPTVFPPKSEKGKKLFGSWSIFF